MKLNAFDIKKANDGAEVVTRAGRPVRILCCDRDDEYPIVGLIDGSDLASWSVDGKYDIFGDNPEYDLRIKPTLRTVYHMVAMELDDQTVVPRWLIFNFFCKQAAEEYRETHLYDATRFDNIVIYEHTYEVK